MSQVSLFQINVNRNERGVFRTSLMLAGDQIAFRDVAEVNDGIDQLREAFAIEGDIKVNYGRDFMNGGRL